MKTSVFFGILAFAFLLLFLYSLDLYCFLRFEKKRFESVSDRKKYVLELEEKQKKSKHPQKRNFYLYLICLSWTMDGERERALRLLPFLKNDFLLGIDKNNL